MANSCTRFPSFTVITRNGISGASPLRRYQLKSIHAHTNLLVDRLNTPKGRLITSGPASLRQPPDTKNISTMLVLTETAIGFVVFKLSSDAKLDNKDLWKEFETPEGANKA